MRSQPAQTRVDRNTYIPPGVQQAMTQHMQQSMPAHLKKYVGENAAYVPRHMEAQVAQQMQKNMPSHLKQYAGAYMQQQVMQPNASRLHGPAPGPRQTFTPPPAPDKLRRGHSMPAGEQHTVELNTLPNDTSMFQAEGTQAPSPLSPQSDQQTPYPQGPQHVAPEQAFDFIMNPEQPKKGSRFSLGDSLPIKIAFIGGALVIVLIIITIIKSMFGGSAIPTSFITVAQQQQQILILASDASKQPNLTTANKNFTSTTQLSVGSSQSDLINYLVLNGQKVNAKQLSLGINPTLTSQLEASAAAATYNETYKSIMKTQLNKYINQLKATYQESSGEKGRALLNSDFKQAELLLIQLEDTRS